jgi:two-component system, LuxR family, sensor kinase FixL
MSAARDSDALFRTLITTAVDGILVIDEHGIVSAYNDAARKLFLYVPDEVLGNNVSMLMPSPFREEHDGYLKHYRDTGEKRIIGIGREVVGQRKDGSTFPMYLSVGEGMLEEKRVFVGIVHDLTARSITARRMQDMQSELLHVSRLSAMGQMTAAIAHELNQPLTAVLNYINAARRTIPPNDAQSRRALELMDKAAAQTSRAGDIIRQLRNFVEKRETSRVEANLNLVVEEAISLAAVGSADANVKLILQLEPHLPPLHIDRIQVQQVIINLIRNSLEAMRDVPLRELRIKTAREKDAVTISISDTGPGLAPEIANRLFHPFVTTKEKGMGIGLSICRSIVEAHGGRIWAESNSEGAAFHVSLPVPGMD